MSLKYTTDGGILRVFPEGSIQATNSAAFDTEIKQLIAEHPGLPVCLDADHMTYISSSGLRVVMSLAKALGNDAFSVQNVNAEMYEIFDVTGFTSLMKVQRKPRELSVDGCPVIGRGAFGTVYRLNEDTVVKVYRGGDSMLPMIENERNRARQAFLKGIPTAIPFDMVRVGDDYGAVFEMVNAHSLTDLVIESPENIPALAVRYAEFLHGIHELDTAPGTLPAIRDRCLGYLDSFPDALRPETFRRIRELLLAVPEDLHLLHGDAHWKNIMDSNGTLMVIDMDTLCTGNPVFEFGGLFMSYIAFNEDDPDNSMQFHGFSTETAARIYFEILKAYFGDTEPERMRTIQDAIGLIGYVRFLSVLILEMKDDTSARKMMRIRRVAGLLDRLAQRVHTLTI